jgi:superfamily I DNA/RNA helicase
MHSAAKTDEEIAAAEKAQEVALVYEHYQKRLVAEGAVDYGDLIMRPTLKMRADPDFRAAMRARFTHVHVDEYQDVNRASAMLVKEIVGTGDNLWVVGDARQSIYRFRGASAANIARFEMDYRKARRDGLEENYRSTAEIVNLYTGFGGTMKVRAFAGDGGLKAAKGGGGHIPALFACADSETEMDTLAASIRALEADGVELNAQVVLARSNGALARFAEELEARDIPVLYLGPLFERPEVRDLLSLLSILADDVGSGLVRVAAFPEYKVPLADTLAVIQAARSTEDRVLYLLRKLDTVGGLSPAARISLTRLASHLHGMNQGTTPWLALSKFLFDSSEYFSTVLSGQTPSDALRRVAVRQLLDALRGMPLHGTGTPIRRALDRIRHMIMLADERDLRQLPQELDGLAGVRLMTVHASKGLEFDAVHLPGLFAGAVPAANRPPACPPPLGMLEAEDVDAHEAEEECILFVAMSRAKAHLHLYRPMERNGRKANPSKFLDRVPAQPGPRLAGIRRTAPAPQFPAIENPPPPGALTGSDIERYASCPRRFFYERVLGLSRRSKAGAYLDAHACLQKVIAYVRELGEGASYSRDEAEAIFNRAWIDSGLEGHPFGNAYRKLTSAMLGRLHTSASGAGAGGSDLNTRIGAEVITLKVDRVIRQEGADVLRTIRSGRQSSGDPDKLSTSLLIKAVREAHGEQARLENHYLMTGVIVEITQTKAKYDKRIADCASVIGDIRAGLYPPQQDDFICPRCPYLFICPAPIADL